MKLVGVHISVDVDYNYAENSKVVEEETGECKGPYVRWDDAFLDRIQARI